MTPPDGFDPHAWIGIATANLSDVVGRMGAMDGGIRRLSGKRLAGPAHTVTTGIGDSSTIHRALVEARPGSVLVVVEHDRGTLSPASLEALTAARSPLRRLCARKLSDMLQVRDFAWFPGACSRLA